MSSIALNNFTSVIYATPTPGSGRVDTLNEMQHVSCHVLDYLLSRSTKEFTRYDLKVHMGRGGGMPPDPLDMYGIIEKVAPYFFHDLAPLTQSKCVGLKVQISKQREMKIHCFCK